MCAPQSAFEKSYSLLHALGFSQPYKLVQLVGIFGSPPRPSSQWWTRRFTALILVKVIRLSPLFITLRITLSILPILSHSIGYYLDL